MGAVAVDSVSDLLLLLLHANGRLRGRSRLAGVTRLQKLLFLLTETPEYKELVRADLAPPLMFRPYKMGPFTPDVYEGIEVLTTFARPLIEATYPAATTAGQDDVEMREYVEETDLDEGYPARGPVQRPAVFSLTRDGEQVAGYLRDNGPPSLSMVIDALVREFGEMPLRQLLQHVYVSHQKMTGNSVIKAELGLA